jgi:hypothetical protein
VLASDLDRFFDFIVKSSYMDLLHEYSTASTEIQQGLRLASAHVADSEPGTLTPSGRQVTDDQIRTALQGWITNHTVPATTANTLYFIYLPPNVVCLALNLQSCGSPQGFCGYHNHIGNIYYAVIPYVNCSGCVFPGQFLDTLTEVSSHEFAEAITDPEANGWYDVSGDEIGDICNRQTTTLGGFLVQTEWSNAQGACAVPRESRWLHNVPGAASDVLVASGTSPTSWYTTPENVQHIAYVGTDQRIQELFFAIGPNGQWLPGVPGAASDVFVASGTSPTSWYTTPENVQHIAYVGTDQRIQELFYTIR